MRYDRSHAVANRHKALMHLIEAGSYSSPALAKKLGVSEQTVYRDIMFLRRKGHHIVSTRSASNWAYQLSPKSQNGKKYQKRLR